MDGRAFVIAKEVFHHRNGNILTLWDLSYDEKRFFLSKYNYINKHYYSVKTFNNFKLRYIDPYNFLTTRASVSQPSTLVVAKTLTFRIIWIHQLIFQQSSLPLYNTHPTWLSLTNELIFND